MTQKHLPITANYVRQRLEQHNPLVDEFLEKKIVPLFTTYMARTVTFKDTSFTLVQKFGSMSHLKVQLEMRGFHVKIEEGPLLIISVDPIK